MRNSSAFPISPAEVTRADGPLVRVLLGSDGLPVAACAASVIEASSDRVWQLVTDVAGYAERVPLMHRVDVHGDWAEFSLKLKITIFRSRFFVRYEHEA